MPTLNKEIKRWEYLILILSFYVVLEVIITTIIGKGSYNWEVYSLKTRDTLWYIDTIICVIFLYDFFNGLLNSKRKLHYIEVHWIDFLGSIPYAGPLRCCRLFRIFRVLRLLRSSKNIFRFFYKKSSLDIFNLAFLGISLVVSVSTFSIYYLEKELGNEKLSTISDCFWWTIYTMIGVGYDDARPLGPEGLFFSVLLMLCGIALVGMVTGLVVDHIIHDKQIKEQLDDKKIQMDRLEKKVDRLINKINKNNLNKNK